MDRDEELPSPTERIDDGFALVEALAVIVILAILATVTALAVRGLV